MRFRIFNSLVLTLALMLGTVNCHRQVHVANVPVGVGEGQVKNWYAATGAFKVAAENTEKITAAVVQLHKEFPDEATYQKTLEALGRMAQTEAQAAIYLDTVPQNWGKPVAQQVKGYTDALSTQAKIALDDGLAHVKNKTAVAAIQTSISLLQAAITTAITLTTT